MRASTVWLVVLGAAGCSASTPGDKEPIACTMEARAGLSLEVMTRAGDSLPVEPAGIARDGSFEETLSVFGNRLAGAYERKGTYAISVSAPGYASWDTAGVVVGADECHVIPVLIPVRLSTAP